MYSNIHFCFVSLFSKLRDIALKRFQLTEVDLSSAVFLSAFVASAGKKVTELSLLSKVILGFVNFYIDEFSLDRTYDPMISSPSFGSKDQD